MLLFDVDPKLDLMHGFINKFCSASVACFESLRSFVSYYSWGWISERLPSWMLRLNMAVMQLSTSTVLKNKICQSLTIKKCEFEPYHVLCVSFFRKNGSSSVDHNVLLLQTASAKPIAVCNVCCLQQILTSRTCGKS